MNPSVKSMSIYPLKSGAGLSVEAAELAQRGLWADRKFMLVHAKANDEGVYRFISQRDKGAEKLALVKALPYEASDGPRMMFEFPDEHRLLVKRDAPRNSLLVNVWKDTLAGNEHSSLASNMFSTYLNIDCRLVEFREDTMRQSDLSFSQKGDQTAFADGFPLLITNQASLDALNAEIPQEHRVEMSRFRPNIVLEGLAPFEEDTISALQIGDTVIELVKPCTRCKLVTVDQETSDIPSKDPLQTLARVRRGKADGLQGVFFGQNAVPRHLGTMNVGDDVKILSRKPMHPAVQQAKLKF